MSDLQYLLSAIKAPNIVPTAGSRNKFFQQWQALGSTPTNAQKLNFMYDVASNSPIAFRREGQFGEDPEILTLFTPAGSTQLGRLNFTDAVLNMYTVDNTFSIVSLGKAIGRIASTFESSDAEPPTSLVSVIGNMGTVKMRGYYPVATGDSDAGPGDGAIANVIGQDVALSANVPDNSNLIQAINSVAAKHPPTILTSFCSTHTIPTTSTTLAAEMLAAMKVIAHPNSISIGDADDITDCILGASIIAGGTSDSKTVTVNACPGFDSMAGTCQARSDSNTYNSKSDCISGTKNYFTSLKTGGANIYTNAITNTKLSESLAGEVCAQYPD